MQLPKIEPIRLTEYISQDPPGGFYFFSPGCGFFSLQAEKAEGARLNLYDNNLKKITSFDLQPFLKQGGLFAIALKDLPPCFAYSWQVQRFGLWGEAFADPLHPWLAGEHLWKGPTKPLLSFIDAKALGADERPCHYKVPALTTSQRPNLPWGSLRLYECHVRAATMHLPTVDPIYRGTLEALPHILDHVQALGCNAIELLPLHSFDEQRCPFRDPISGAPLVNFWGYMPNHLLAIMRAYSASGQSLQAEKALASFIDQAHERGLEVIQDVVFNHVDLTRAQSLWQTLPSSAFFRSRALDSQQSFENQEDLIDYSGCGNTLNLQHPAVSAQIIHSLREWARRFGFDGFRFDLGGAFARMEDGRCNPRSPFLEKLTQDPFLQGLKLIIEPWDAKGAWLVGQLAPQGLYEWNDRFRDDIKRFIHFGENKGLAATRLAGSSDLYGDCKRPSSIHYISCHDGFSLYDLVSYNTRHNEANGEGGRDGHGENLSRNHGVEGQTKDPIILALREKQLRNHILALTISHGPIMLLAGDEYGHTREGNNNPWCQDNALNAINWSLATSSSLQDYWKRLLKWRSHFNLLESENFYNEHHCRWLASDATPCDWQGEAGVLIFELRSSPKRALVLFNSRETPLSVRPPTADHPWELVAASGNCPERLQPGERLILEAWSSALFESHD